jgi:hypothetical protein
MLKMIGLGRLTPNSTLLDALLWVWVQAGHGLVLFYLFPKCIPKMVLVGYHWMSPDAQIVANWTDKATSQAKCILDLEIKYGYEQKVKTCRF